MSLMHRYIWFSVLLSAMPPVFASSFNFGVGQSIIDGVHSEAAGSGWDVQVGYAFARKRAWDFGLQLQITRQENSDTEFTSPSDLAFSSNALYLSARPSDWWLYFKGGVVHVDYRTLAKAQEDVGLGLGAGITYGSGDIRLHLLDYQRISVGDDSFNMYTISLAVLLQ